MELKSQLKAHPETAGILSLFILRLQPTNVDTACEIAGIAAGLTKC